MKRAGAQSAEHDSKHKIPPRQKHEGPRLLAAGCLPSPTGVWRDDVSPSRIPAGQSGQNSL